jgi:hypothetical protein
MTSIPNEWDRQYRSKVCVPHHELPHGSVELSLLTRRQEDIDLSLSGETDYTISP